MAKKKKKGRVSTHSDMLAMFADPVFVGPGYVLPPTFTSRWEPEGGPVVETAVAVRDGRAVCERLTVEAPDGVSSAMLRRIPVRDIVATGCVNVMLKVGVIGEGQFRGAPIGEEDADAVREIVQRLVGYKPATDRGEVRS